MRKLDPIIFDPIITEIFDKLLWHLHVVDKRMFDLKTILKCGGDEKLAKVVKGNVAILGEDHPLSQEATLFSELSLSKLGVSLGGHLLTAKPDPKNTELKVEELTNWWEELKTFFTTQKSQPSTIDAACSVLTKWFNELPSNKPDILKKLLGDIFTFKQNNSVKAQPENKEKRKKPASPKNFPGSGFSKEQKQEKQEKKDVTRVSNTDTQTAEKTLGVIDTLTRDERTSEVPRFLKRNDQGVNNSVLSTETKESPASGSISSRYSSYAEILRYGEPIRPVDYCSEGHNPPCPLMKLSLSLEEERNCPHLHLVQGEYEYEYSLSLLSKNPPGTQKPSEKIQPYINAILLRMKLLGMVVAIKGEIADFMTAQQEKHPEHKAPPSNWRRREVANWYRAHEFSCALHELHDVTINPDTGNANTGCWKKFFFLELPPLGYFIKNLMAAGIDKCKIGMFKLKKLFFLGLPALGYFIENLIAAGIDKVKTVLFILSLISIFIVIFFWWGLFY